MSTEDVRANAPDAWLDASKTRTGCEISFTRDVYKPDALRPLEEIRAGILATEREIERLLTRGFVRS